MLTKIICFILVIYILWIIWFKNLPDDFDIIIRNPLFILLIIITLFIISFNTKTKFDIILVMLIVIAYLFSYHLLDEDTLDDDLNVLDNKYTTDSPIGKAFDNVRF